MFFFACRHRDRSVTFPVETAATANSGSEVSTSTVYINSTEGLSTVQASCKIGLFVLGGAYPALHSSSADVQMALCAAGTTSREYNGEVNCIGRMGHTKACSQELQRWETKTQVCTTKATDLLRTTQHA